MHVPLLQIVLHWRLAVLFAVLPPPTRVPQYSTGSREVTKYSNVTSSIAVLDQVI